MKKKSSKQYITLACNTCKILKKTQYRSFFYTTRIKKILKKNFNLNKYCPICQKHQNFKP